jgi:hypothetical protein
MAWLVMETIAGGPLLDFMAFILPSGRFCSMWKIVDHRGILFTIAYVANFAKTLTEQYVDFMNMKGRRVETKWREEIYLTSDVAWTWHLMYLKCYSLVRCGLVAKG